MAVSSPPPSKRWSFKLDLLPSGLGSRPKTLAESPSIAVSSLTDSFDSSALSSETNQTQTSQPSAVPLWTPRSDPQRMALESEADEVYYGGAAGGGKTDLLIGAALTQHRRSVIFRREYAQHAAIVDRVRELIAPIENQVAYNGTDRRWRLPGERILELGAAQHEDSVRKWRGRPHDAKLFDELPEFTEGQYLFFGGWARSTVPGQRVRRIGAGNPPTDASGEWVIQRWAPWLDEQHPNPAAPGELRWFVRIDGKDTEVENARPFEHDGEMLYPQSRTFIPARLADNQFLSRDPAYRATLQAMPEPLRSQLLYGDHSIGLQDDPWQVIPTPWVRQAQARWKPDGGVGPADQHGIDVAQGGADNTVDVERHGDWFSQPVIIPGKDVPDAQANADEVERFMVSGGVGNIDADGIGSSTYFLARATLGDRVHPYQGSAQTKWQDKARVLKFVNTRAAAWWSLREALDPSSGRQIALPPSRELRVELCAPRWEKQVNGVKIEKKDEVKARLGRSPDIADAVVMAHWDGRSPLHGVLARAVSPAPATPANINANLPTLNGRLLPEQRSRLRLTRG